MPHISFYRCSVNVLTGDECCRMVRVAKGRLPKQTLTALPSRRSRSCSSQILNQADRGKSGLWGKGKKKLVPIPVFSPLGCVTAGANAVSCQLCKLCTQLCVLSVDMLVCDRPVFHLTRLFAVWASAGRYPRFLAVHLCDALIPFRSASGGQCQCGIRTEEICKLKR